MRSKPQWNLPVEPRTILQRPFEDLLWFPCLGGNPQAQIFLVAPLSGHYATLLRPTLQQLLPYYDVYLTDWKNARDVPIEAGSFSFDDYLAYLLDDMRTISGPYHVMAVCQPVPAVLAAVALLSQRQEEVPVTMTLLGGPVDTRINPTSVNTFATSYSLSWFAQMLTMEVPHGNMGAGRRVYPGFLQLNAFMAMHPDKHLSAFSQLYMDSLQGNTLGVGRCKEFYDEYFATMDMTAEFYLQTLDVIFQRQLLARNALIWNNEHIDVGAITKTALLTIEGEKDDICAVGQTQAAHQLCTGLAATQKHHHIESDTGHYGLFSGSHWKTSIAPRIRRFVSAHSF
jgi:poly(3-hydroxybutyrate) depolymerase